MGVTVVTNRKDREANGVLTDFDFDFLVYQDSDLLVYEVELDDDGFTVSAELKTLGADYTVVLDPTVEGGTVHTLYTPADGKIIRMIGDIPETQETDFPIGTGFSETRIRTALDKLTRLVNQIRDRLNFAILRPISDGDTDTFTLTQLDAAVAAADADRIAAETAKDDAVTAKVAAQAAQAAAVAAAASIIPVFAGFIGMYSGTLASIPAGWQLCDGTNGTPNLLGKMIPCVKTATNPGAVSGNDYVMPHTHTADAHNHDMTHKDGADTRLQTTVDGSDEVNTDYIASAVVTLQSTGAATAYALAYIMKL